MTNSTLLSAEEHPGGAWAGHGSDRYASTLWFESTIPWSGKEAPLPDGRGSVTEGALLTVAVQ